MLSRQRSTGHKNPARPFARGEPQTERITVRMPKDNNRRASFHVRPCPSLTCSHEDCLLRCPLMMTAHQLTILGQARVPCTCFCLCIVVAHTQTKKTMVSCKCLHTKKLQIEAIVVKNTPAAAADDNPGLPRLVFPVRFRFFGPFRPDNLKMEWDDKTGLPKLVIPVRFEVFWPKRAQKSRNGLG